MRVENSQALQYEVTSAHVCLSQRKSLQEFVSDSFFSLFIGRLIKKLGARVLYQLCEEDRHGYHRP